MTDAPKRENRSLWTRAVIGLVSLLLYALSPGPVQVMLAKMRVYAAATPNWPVIASIYESVYAPLNWLCDHIPTVAQFYGWYIGLFEPFFP